MSQVNKVMEIWKVDTKMVDRHDGSIMDDIWRSFWNDPTIRAIDIHDISMDVEKGQVCLYGHVSKEYNKHQFEEITRSIPGVMAVHNHLITDCDLKAKVAQALDENESIQPFSLPISCYHGWIEVEGLVPTQELQHIVESIAASVANVRGVILLPSVKGENTFQEREAVQPGIGVQVYGKDQTRGMVYQVVITPQNRLVTHANVRVNRNANGWQELCDYLIPVEAMDVVEISGIFLNYNEPEIHKFSRFTSADYPYAPLTWQPPYPYKVGSVRWPRLEKVKTEPRAIEKNE